MIGAIAHDKSLYNMFVDKNSYHHMAMDPGGVISGRYPIILNLCSHIKTECELNHIGLSAMTVATQQAHRTGLEDTHVTAEEQAATELQASTKTKKSKGKKSKKSKAIVEDIDDDTSVFDNSEFPMTGSGEVDNPIQIDTEWVEEATPSTSHHTTTQSLNARAFMSPPNYEGFFRKFAELLNHVQNMSQ
ncbi:hypothetical protein DFH08DRAFT_957625 [Mycena albidolilacea]|uniref:Uncharacterized protein n=1 Tax=Mycena albidolilacea TaxID=1033008 RepID=A0AAD7A8D1_9AGAR|nr:hypothetical protein DFH08DRAFT_957625 [Mycena albidolilacea]